MKRLAPFLLIAVMAHAQEKALPCPAEPPAQAESASPQPPPGKIQIHVMPEELNRALDESELLHLLYEDWLAMDVKHGHLHVANRKRIAVLMDRLRKEP